MTEADMVKIRNGARALGIILKKDQTATDASVNLGPTERNFIDGARHGLLQMIQSAQEKAEKKLDLAESELEKAQETSFDLQLEMFDTSGKPTTALDANGKAIAREKDWENETPPEGIHPDDGTQGTLAEADSTEVETFGTVAERVQPNPWAVKPTVPDHVEAQILSAVAEGLSPAKVIGQVSKATNSTKIEVAGWIEMLVKGGKLAKKAQRLVIPEAAYPESEPAESEQASEPEQGDVQQIADNIPNMETIAGHIFAKLLELKQKPEVCSATAAELGVPEPAVVATFDGLVLSNRIRRTVAGWSIVAQSEAPESDQMAG